MKKILIALALSILFLGCQKEDNHLFKCTKKILVDFKEPLIQSNYSETYFDFYGTFEDMTNMTVSIKENIEYTDNITYISCGCELIK